MNNIQHLRYAVEVERTGSISKAAENLYMGQPHLSKAIRELENEIGFAIFNRTPKGVIPTQKGKGFLEYTRNILNQIDEMEARYKPSPEGKQEIRIAVPRASYISYAFTEFLKTLDFDNDIKVDYRETNSLHAISDVASSTDDIAVIRYQLDYEKYFLTSLEDNNLRHELIKEFEYHALMSTSHPLAACSEVSYEELQQFPEINHGDISVPALPLSEARRFAQSLDRKKSIKVYERGSQLEILSRVPNTYMWVSPMPRDVLDRFGLVELPCDASKNRFADVFIYRHGYRLTANDKKFLELLKKAAAEMV